MKIQRRGDPQSNYYDSLNNDNTLFYELGDDLHVNQENRPEVISTFRGQKDALTSLSWNKKNKQQIATACQDGSVYVWSFKPSQRPLKFTGHKGAVHDVAYHPGGHSIASCSQDKTIRLWDNSSLGSFTELKGHTGGIRSVSFSPNGHFLLSGSDDKLVKMWKTGHEKKYLLSLHGHLNWVRQVNFSPDGILGLSCSDDRTARLWDLTQQTTISTFTDLPAPVSPNSPLPSSPLLSSIFLSSGNTIATGNSQGFLRLWDLRSHKVLIDVKAHDDAIHSLDVSPQGGPVVLLSTSADGSARLWDLRRPNLLFALFPHGGAVSCGRFGDASTFATVGAVDRQLMVWRRDVSEREDERRDEERREEKRGEEKREKKTPLPAKNNLRVPKVNVINHAIESDLSRRRLDAFSKGITSSAIGFDDNNGVKYSFDKHEEKKKEEKKRDGKIGDEEKKNLREEEKKGRISAAEEFLREAKKKASEHLFSLKNAAVIASSPGYNGRQVKPSVSRPLSSKTPGSLPQREEKRSDERREGRERYVDYNDNGADRKEAEEMGGNWHQEVKKSIADYGLLVQSISLLEKRVSAIEKRLGPPHSIAQSSPLLPYHNTEKPIPYEPSVSSFVRVNPNLHGHESQPKYSPAHANASFNATQSFLAQQSSFAYPNEALHANSGIISFHDVNSSYLAGHGKGQPVSGMEKESQYEEGRESDSRAGCLREELSDQGKYGRMREVSNYSEEKGDYSPKEKSMGGSIYYDNVHYGSKEMLKEYLIERNIIQLDIACSRSCSPSDSERLLLRGRGGAGVEQATPEERRREEKRDMSLGAEGNISFQTQHSFRTTFEEPRKAAAEREGEGEMKYTTGEREARNSFGEKEKRSVAGEKLGRSPTIERELRSAIDKEKKNRELRHEQNAEEMLFPNSPFHSCDNHLRRVVHVTSDEPFRNPSFPLYENTFSQRNSTHQSHYEDLGNSPTSSVGDQEKKDKTD